MFAEDFAPFFAEFGEVAVFGAQQVRGVFDTASASTLDVYGTQPVFTAATASLAGVAVGAGAVIRGVSYTVVGVEPDGTGITVLRLERV